ncbi:MAG: LuxR C-terminal-related transcriptional regulator [Thermoleophilia bacterium]
MSTRPAASPLLETKLRPPGRRAGLVPRPAAAARLEQAARRRLTLVSAPAGWGKTTLVGDWLAGRSGGSAWVAIDEGDNDPARFWRYAAAALRRIGAPVDDQAVGALAGAADTREAGLAALVNALGELEPASVLALDDYHLIEEPAIHEALTFVCRHAPEGFGLVMTTRGDPPLELARLRTRGDLAEIRVDELRFGDADAGALLERAAGMRLDPGDVERLLRRTEGWAAGLYLAGLSLRGRDDAAGFIADFAGDDRMVVDYLAEEVLEGQDDERRAFLLRTSVLRRLSGPLCDAVTGASGSGRLLAELERSNLFLVPLDSRREWYRYHHLFGELLQHELALATAHEEVRELHRRAAAWHLDHASPDDAIHHLVAAGDLDRAADVIDAHWSLHLRTGWTATIERWLDLLPAQMVRADRRLCLARAWISINLGRPESASEWLDLADGADGGRPVAAGEPPPAESALSARALERCLVGDVESALRLGREAVAVTRGEEGWWRAAACLALGIALHATGDIDAATPFLEEATDVGMRTNAVAVALVSLCHLAHDDIAIRGDVARGERRAREAMALAASESHSEYPHAAGAHSALALALAARGDIEAALDAARRGVELARRGRAPTEVAHSIVVLGEVSLTGGDAAGARRAAARAREALAAGPDAGGYIVERIEAIEGGASPPAPPSRDAGPLSGREAEVLRMLGGLGSMRDIARELHVSHNTVKTQVRSIYRKLGVATRDEAVAAARERGLLPRSLAPGGP